MTLFPTFLAGTNFTLHAAGWLESGLTASYEKFAMDIEICRMMQVFRRGIALDQEGLALDAFAEVGPGGYFFGAEHTLRHFRDAFYRPLIADTQNYARWEQKGAETADVRANRIWKKWLNEYAQPAMDAGMRQALDEYIAKRKREISVTPNV